jgi:hypothetical protein
VVVIDVRKIMSAPVSVMHSWCSPTCCTRENASPTPGTCDEYTGSALPLTKSSGAISTYISSDPLSANNLVAVNEKFTPVVSVGEYT